VDGPILGGGLATYDEAVQFCQDEGGYLLSADSEHAQAMLMTAGFERDVDLWVGLKFDGEKYVW